MKLADWLLAKNMKPIEFARLIEAANPSMVSKYLKGQRIPRAETMRKIIEVTGGEVTANDFYAQEAA